MGVISQLRQFMGNRTGIVQNALWLLGDKVTKALCMLVISALLARYFGPGTYGKLAYAVAYIAIFQGIANLGLDAITVREIATQRKRSPEIIGTVFGLRLMAGMILWPLSALLAYLFGQNSQGDLIIIALVGGILLFQATDTIDLWFQSQGNNQTTVMAKLSVYLIGSAARLYLLYLNCPLWIFALMVTIDAAILSLALIFMYQRFPIDRRWQFKRNEAVGFLLESWPFMLSGVAVLVYARIDQIMIKNFLGEYSLGIYSVAILISGFFAIIPVSISTAVAPYVASLKRDSYQGYMRAIGLISLFLFILAVAISATVCLTADHIVNLLYGDQYTRATAVLRIHIFTIIPIFLGVGQSLWLINEKKGKIILNKTVTGVILSVTLNLIFIPRFGINSAAYVAVFTFFVVAVFSNLILDRQFFNLQMQIIFRPRTVFSDGK